MKSLAASRKATPSGNAVPQTGTSPLSLQAGFVLTGIATVLLGPVLPYVAARWQLSDAKSGTLFTAQFAGSMAGVALVGWLSRGIGLRRVVAVGSFVVATGLAAFAVVVGTVAPWSWAGAAVVVYGIGLGLVIPSTNLFMAATGSPRPSIALNRLNAAWCAGAVICAPLWIAFSRAGWQAGFLAALAGAVACSGVWVTITAQRIEPAHPPAAPDGKTPPSFARSAAILGLLLFLYVGTETSIGGWVATYALRASGRTAALAMPSFFWLMLMIGRISSASLLRRISDARLLLASLALALAGTLILVMDPVPAFIIAGTVISALGLACVYPLVVAVFARLGPRSHDIAGLVFAAAGLGGAVIPAAVGRASTAAGNLRIGIVICVLGCALMLAISASVRSTFRPPP